MCAMRGNTPISVLDMADLHRIVRRTMRSVDVIMQEVEEKVDRMHEHNLSMTDEVKESRTHRDT